MNEQFFYGVQIVNESTRVQGSYFESSEQIKIWAETGHKPLKLSQGQLEEGRESQSDRWKLGKELLECKWWAPSMVLPHLFFENGSANAGYQLGRKKTYFIILPNKQSIDT